MPYAAFREPFVAFCMRLVAFREWLIALYVWRVAFLVRHGAIRLKRARRRFSRGDLQISQIQSSTGGTIMAEDYIPRPDAEFDEWLANFNTYLQAHGAEVGLSEAQLLEIASANTNWHDAYTAQLAAQATARGWTTTKNENKSDAMALARELTRIIQANPGATDAQRRELRITVADEKPTDSEGMRLASAIAAPLIRLDWSQRGQITIHFGPNPANERENGLPRGMKGAKLWYALGGIPASEDDWRWLADDTNSPYTHILASGQSGTIAYRAQYFDARMNLGPMSDPATATVTT
ncbi:hypothetical protein JW998_09025 [candidate division KSB1 bacterium]|nr:hypothetical protein [candidate division KSB1 bacterium]